MSEQARIADEEPLQIREQATAARGGGGRTEPHQRAVVIETGSSRVKRAKELEKVTTRSARSSCRLHRHATRRSSRAAQGQSRTSSANASPSTRPSRSSRKRIKETPRSLRSRSQAQAGRPSSPRGQGRGRAVRRKWPSQGSIKKVEAVIAQAAGSRREAGRAKKRIRRHRGTRRRCRNCRRRVREIKQAALRRKIWRRLDGSPKRGRSTRRQDKGLAEAQVLEENLAKARGETQLEKVGRGFRGSRSCEAQVAAPTSRRHRHAEKFGSARRSPARLRVARRSSACDREEPSRRWPDRWNKEIAREQAELLHRAGEGQHRHRRRRVLRSSQAHGRRRGRRRRQGLDRAGSAAEAAMKLLGGKDGQQRVAEPRG